MRFVQQRLHQTQPCRKRVRIVTQRQSCFIDCTGEASFQEEKVAAILEIASQID